MKTNNKKKISEDIEMYNKNLSDEDSEIGSLLATEIMRSLPDVENKVWHGHPVWFLDGNPIVGYDRLKAGMRLLFWSGMSFKEEQLAPSKSGKFKDASITYTSAKQINKKDLKRWLEKSKEIQWDYKNIVKRKGVLKRLK
jgi:hypothetical protein